MLARNRAGELGGRIAFEDVKQRQCAMWGSAPFGAVVDTEGKHRGGDPVFDRSAYLLVLARRR